jgi:FHS family L-fucose permease-like MFS transporter
MAILGGSVMPPLQGAMIKQEVIFNMPAENVSFIIPLICFVVVAIYGYRTRTFAH